MTVLFTHSADFKALSRRLSNLHNGNMRLRCYHYEAYVHPLYKAHVTGKQSACPLFMQKSLLNLWNMRYISYLCN